MSGGKRLLMLFGCYAFVVILHLVLSEALAQLGRVRAGILAGATGFVIALAGVHVFRRLGGRQSRVAYTLLMASSVPLVLGGIAADEMLTGGRSFWLTLVVAAVPAMVVLMLLQRLLYTREEIAELRAATSWRADGKGGR